MRFGRIGWKLLDMRNLKRKLGAAVAALALLGALGLSVYRFFPLEYADWKGARELRGAGAQQISTQYEGRIVKSWVRDTCTPADPGCRCLLLIHGLGDRATTWKRVLLADPTTWQKPLKLIALDLPGNGDSEPPAADTGYSLRKMAAAAAAVVQSVPGGCGDLWVAGNSMGGGVATWLALDPSLRVRRLILLSPGAIDTPKAWDQAASFPANGDLSQVPSIGLLREISVASLKEFQRRAYFKPRELPAHVWEGVVRRARHSPVSRILKAQTPEELPGARLKEIVAPVVLIWGLSDLIITIEEGRELAKRFRNGVLREIPECGHIPQKECPEAFYSAVNDLLRAGG